MTQSELQACSWCCADPHCTTDGLQSLPQSQLDITVLPSSRAEVRANVSSLGLARYVSHFWMRGTLWRIVSQLLLPTGFLKDQD